MEVNAQLIKSMRSQRSWTQQHLADACGVSLRTVQRVERYGNTSNETAMSLAAVFEIDQSEFVLPDEPVIFIEKSASTNDKNQRKLILSTLLIGMLIGSSLMFAANMFIN